MLAFKVLIFALAAISAAPAEESADYFVFTYFDPYLFDQDANVRPF
jgi:hypothetical protein